MAEALGKSADLLVVKLDITKAADAEAAVKAAVEKFGRLDMLVNNAANFYAGFFEELTPEQMQRQLSTSLVGPMNVTRAVLPVMRKQRSGLIITISSTAGLIGFEFGTAYAASKFGLEGWMQSLQAEVEPFGINTITVNPGFFRTELLTEESTNFAELSIDYYNERRAQQMEFWKGYNGQQSGDPAKLAQAQTPLTPQKRWLQRFSSKPKPTVSCPLPSHTKRRSGADNSIQIDVALRTPFETSASRAALGASFEGRGATYDAMSLCGCSLLDCQRVRGYTFRRSIWSSHQKNQHRQEYPCYSLGSTGSLPVLRRHRVAPVRRRSGGKTHGYQALVQLQRTDSPVEPPTNSPSTPAPISVSTITCQAL